jgi:hypothetical protein
MIKEKYIILTIPLIFFAILLVTSTITTASASINNYFKDKDEDDYENKFYREKYKEKIYHQDALCDDPQAVKKYGEVCRGHGNSFEDAKEGCKDKGGEWNNGKCKFEDDDEDEKDFEDEFEEEEEDKEDD